MKATTANLKIFYQRPALYFWYFIILCQLPVLIISWISPAKMDGAWTVSYFTISMLFGMTIGSLQKDILCRPVTFCLPKHHRINHKLIFTIGVLFTIIPTAMMTKAIMLSANSFWLTTAALWAISLLGYLATVCMSYQASFSSGRPSLAGGVWMVMFFSLFFGGFQKIRSIALESPLVLIIPSLALTVYFWFYFRKESHRRNLCGQSAMSMFAGWDLQRANAMQISHFAKKSKDRGRISLWLERFFVGKIKSDPQAKNKAAAGAVYISLDRMTTMSHITMGPMALVVLAFGYFIGTDQVGAGCDMGTPMSLLDVFYIMPVFGAMMHAFPSHATLHIPAKRQDKLYASLTMGVSIVIFATAFIGLIVGVATIIAPHMPEIPFGIFSKQEVMTFYAPKLSHIYIIPMLMPLGFTASVLFGHNKTGMLFAGPVIYACCIFYVFSQAFLNIPLAVPCIFAVSWLSFIAALRWHCLKRNLV
jgi:hypothetical protein